MSICRHFLNPAEHCACRAGVEYLTLAGGAVYTMVLRLPCFELSNRRKEDIKHCDKYQGEQDEHD